MYDKRHLRKMRGELRKLDPWRNPPKTPVARATLNKEELFKLSNEQLRKLLLEELGRAPAKNLNRPT